MAIRRRRKKSGFAFWKLLGVLVLVTALVWYFQSFKTKTTKPSNVMTQTSEDRQKTNPANTQAQKNPNVFPETVPVKSPESKAAESQKTETQRSETQASTLPDIPKKTISKNVLPEHAWQDDYIKLDYPDKKGGKQLLLISYGLVPEGKSADKIRNPDVLKPVVAMVQRSAEGYDKISEINLLKSSGDKHLKGIARFKSADLVDIDKDGLPEIILHFDSSGESTEKIGLLKWDGKTLQWMKKKVDKTEKAALWNTGTSGTSKKSIKLEKTKIIEQVTGFDAAHPNKGFETKKTEWRFEDGVWVKK
ncbi:MAG: hypothetical protein HQM15_07735 [Deltaproteobacteria bacterium]|nr:hypothetical protein [Deltaproteobacteria bacterium]